jgi:glutamate/tyrosine decarboxylase-like PLP-dependent enzyme
MRLEKDTLKILSKALLLLERGFTDLPEAAPAEIDLQQAEAVLMQVARRMQDNFPYFHPLYAGQMLKPPHPVARAAYMLAMWINPNNHALDGGRASSHLEKEAVAQIAGLFGWREFLGHLTGGGTMANLEALWIAGQLRPGTKIVASRQAHYTHQRICGVLGLDFEPVGCDARARMNPAELEALLERGDVGTVVATVGTTGCGAVDPLGAILALKSRFDFRLHVDAAYGGYFTLVDNLQPETQDSYRRLGQADSIVIDPHKHGLQPYGCGCVLYRDPAVGRFYQHDSPYTYFSSPELHLGEISLECSRPGASATALWATMQMMPLVAGGEFAKGLGASRRAALNLYDKLRQDSNFRTLFGPELDIVIWAPQGDRAGLISSRSQAIFKAAAGKNLHLATFGFPCAGLTEIWPDVSFDQDTVTLLRSCLMKPEHEQWIESIWTLIKQAAAEIC